MLELLITGRACEACGARVRWRRALRAARREWRGGASLEARVAGALLRRDAPRERSGLAYASGFAGVLFLFGHSLAPLALLTAGGSWGLAAGLLLLLSAPAPLALGLAFAAAVSLDRSPRKSGALPALFGFSFGLFGTLDALFMLAR